MADTENINKEKWEHETLRELVFTSLKEQRKARNWGIFFRLLTFSYLFVLLFWDWAGWILKWQEGLESILHWLIYAARSPQMV